MHDGWLSWAFAVMFVLGRRTSMKARLKSRDQETREGLNERTRSIEPGEDGSEKSNLVCFSVRCASPEHQQSVRRQTRVAFYRW